MQAEREREMNKAFWEALDALVREHAIEIDRPRGSEHPRYPGVVYPLDYGYLVGTTSGDGQGIDIWRGSMAGMVVTGVVVTVDAFRKDAEIKVLIGCTAEEMAIAAATHRTGSQAAMLIERDGGRS